MPTTMPTGFAPLPTGFLLPASNPPYPLGSWKRLTRAFSPASDPGCAGAALRGRNPPMDFPRSTKQAERASNRHCPAHAVTYPPRPAKPHDKPHDKPTSEHYLMASTVTSGQLHCERGGWDVFSASDPRREIPAQSGRKGFRARSLTTFNYSRKSSARPHERHEAGTSVAQALDQAPAASRPRRRSATIVAHTVPTRIRQSTEIHISLAIVTFDPMMANHGNEVSPMPAAHQCQPIANRIAGSGQATRARSLTTKQLSEASEGARGLSFGNRARTTGRAKLADCRAGWLKHVEVHNQNTRPHFLLFPENLRASA